MRLPAPSRVTPGWFPPPVVDPRCAPPAREVAELAGALRLDSWALTPAQQWGLDGPPALASPGDYQREHAARTWHRPSRRVW